MINRKYLLWLFSIFYIAIIFSEDQKILWDFGVKIKSSNEQDSLNKTNALIANRFVPPSSSDLLEKKIPKNISLNSNYRVTVDNIYEIEILVARLTMKNNFQTIIDIITQIDLKQLNNYNRSNLYYCLANAYFYTGKYSEAKNIILSYMPFEIEDYSHFLLAMIYENTGEITSARSEYLQLIKEFPSSDLKKSALIKTRLLAKLK